MSLAAITNLVTSKVGRQVLTVQKHSPVLLFGVGIVGVGATVVLACKATLKVEHVLNEAEERKAKIALARQTLGEEYSEEDAKKDGLTTRVKLAIDIAKLYAPAVAVGVLTVSALTGSHFILTKRNLAITAAYGSIQKGFDEYRSRVVEELGEGKDLEFRYGVEEVTVGVETDEGVAEKTIKRVKFDTPSDYAVWFDETSPNWEQSVASNRTFLRLQQNYLNDMLEARGHVFLNEFYDRIGVPRTSAGAVVGWVKKNPRGGDGHIDFGVFTRQDSDNRAFVNQLNGPTGDVILLDPNVDGVIYDLI